VEVLRATIKNASTCSVDKSVHEDCFISFLSHQAAIPNLIAYFVGIESGTRVTTIYRGQAFSGETKTTISDRGRIWQYSPLV